MYINRIGDLVEFNYVGEYSNEPRPQVLILHNNSQVRYGEAAHKPFTNTHLSQQERSAKFNEKRLGGRFYVHGIAWHLLTEDEKHYLRSILNPLYADQLKASNASPIIIQKVTQRLTAQLGAASATYGGNQDLMGNPQMFYNRIIKPWLSPTYEVYRLYKPEGISNLKIMIKREILLGQQKEGIFNKYLNKFKDTLKHE